MTRTQIQQLVVVLLLVLFVGVFLLSKKPQESVRTGASAPQAAAPAEARVRAEEPVPAAPPVAAPSNPSIPRDIFLLPSLLIQRLQQRDQEAQRLEQQKGAGGPAAGAGPTSLQPQEPEWKLQGIFWGIAKPQAIINRQIVSVGDRIEAAEVEAISRDSVTLSLNGQEIELKPEAFRSNSKKEESAQRWSPNRNPR